ncbi:MAG: hypothetical protein IPH45_01675 [Bacteroidales bacterium]|nr:hypothetical protein [Bacteroidales bacterium]
MVLTFKKYITFLLFGFILLSSCKKDESEDQLLRFDGMVIDFFNQDAFPNTSVVLHTGSGINVMDSAYFVQEQIDSVKTNLSGRYSFSIDNENRQIYKLRVNKPGYLQVLEPGVLATMVVPQLNTDTIFIGKSAKLVFSAVNNDPTDGDELSVIFYYNMPNSLPGQREWVTKEILVNEGLDPNNYSLNREYFFDLNHTLKMDVITKRMIQGDPVYSTQSLEYNLSHDYTQHVLITF